MKRVLWALALALAVAGAAAAQDYTAITAANIADASGAKLASGSLCFQGTDAAGNPITYQVGGGGQVVRTPVCFTVTNGAVSGAQVANPALTDPEGVLYHVTVTDSTGTVVIDDPLVSVAGATWSFDAYVPGGPVSTPTPLPLQVTQGGTGLSAIVPNGDCLGAANGTYGGVPCSGASGGMVYPGAGVPNSTGSAWGASYTVGTGDGDLLQLGASGLPAVGGSLLSGLTFGQLGGSPSAGQIAGAGTLSNPTSGNAGTASALAATPNQCPSTQIVTGIAANGNANCQDPLVSGPTANGSAPAAGSNPVLTGGWDGTYVRTFSTDSAGRLNVNINGTPAVQIQSDASVNLDQLAGTALGAPSAWGTAPSGDVLGVDANVLSLPPLPVGSNTIGAVNVNGTVPVSGTFWQATQPVSGTVTAAPPTETNVAPQYITSAVTLDSAAGTLDSYQVSDSGTATCYLEFFNAASANVTLGTTAPIAVTVLFPTPSNGFEANSPPDLYLAFSTALSAAAVTTENGTTACPASTVLLNSASYR